MTPWQLLYPWMWAVVRHEALLNRLPDRVQKWIARRAMRDTMASWGLPLDGVSDAALIEGIRVVAGGTSVCDRAAAVTLHRWLMEQPERAR